MGTTFSQDHIFSDRTEELLVKYFDATLSLEELQEFAQLRMNFPELEQEISEFTSFDNALDRSHFDDIIDEDTIDHDFITRMHQHYQKVVITPTSSPSLEAITSNNTVLPWNILTTWWKLPAIIIGSGLTCYIAYTLLTTNVKPPINMNHSTKPETLTNTIEQQPAPSTVDPKIKSTPQRVQAQSEQIPVNPTPPPPTEQYPTSSDAQAKVSIQQSNSEKKIETIIEQYNQTIQQHYREGNSISAALAEKSVGVLYRELGKYTECIALLEKSLKSLKPAKIAESEGEVLGELALTYKAMGNDTKSQQYFQECLDVLQRCNCKNFEYWKKISSRQ